MSEFIDSRVFPNISYQSILDQIQDGIYITNGEHLFVYWNSGAEKLLGYSRDEILGRHCREEGILCGKRNEGLFRCEEAGCPVIRAIEAGFTGTYPHIVFMRRKDGEEIPVSLNVGPVHGDNGERIGGICVFRDMKETYRQRLLAGEIQKTMNTSGVIEKNGVRIHALYQPVDEVGGDLVEAFFPDRETLIVSVADATGHGMSAALFTMIYRTLLHSGLDEHRDPQATLSWINRRFAETSPIEGYYLTANILRLDLQSGRGVFASAGHPPALIYTRKNGTGAWSLRQALDAHSMLIGADPETRYSNMEFTLGKNDLILMGTDGLFEAETADGTFFGVEGISRFMKRWTGENIAMDLYDELKRAGRYIDLTDDVGIIAVRPQGQADTFRDAGIGEPY